MYEAKAANKNCVRFAADLASKESSKRATVYEEAIETVLVTNGISSA
jgi:hypothetical protein